MGNVNPRQVSMKWLTAIEQRLHRPKSETQPAALNGLGHTSKISAPSPPRMVFDCLALHPRVPRWAAPVLPIVLIANMVLLYTSNVADAASLFMDLRVGEVDVRLPVLFTVSIQGSISELWGAKQYWLAALVLALSGIWPYFKMFMMLLAWCAPTRILPVSLNKAMIGWLELLGKTALLDVFIVIVIMAIVHLDVSFWNDSLGLKLAIIPVWGFYAFCMSFMISLTVSHMLALAFDHAHNHERALQPTPIPLKGIKSENLVDSKVPFYNYKLSWHCGILASPRVRATLFPILSLGGSVTLYFATAMDLFTVNYRGAIGDFMKANVRHFSIQGIIRSIPHLGMVRTTDLDVLQWGTLFLTVVAPLAFLVIAVVLWLTPLTIRAQQRAKVMLESLFAWSSLEMLVVTIFVCLRSVPELVSHLVEYYLPWLYSFLHWFLSSRFGKDPMLVHLELNFVNPGLALAVSVVLIEYTLLQIIMRTLSGAELTAFNTKRITTSTERDSDSSLST